MALRNLTLGSPATKVAHPYLTESTTSNANFTPSGAMVDEPVATNVDLSHEESPRVMEAQNNERTPEQTAAKEDCVNGLGNITLLLVINFVVLSCFVHFGGIAFVAGHLKCPPPCPVLVCPAPDCPPVLCPACPPKFNNEETMGAADSDTEVMRKGGVMTLPYDMGLTAVFV